MPSADGGDRSRADSTDVANRRGRRGPSCDAASAVEVGSVRRVSGPVEPAPDRTPIGAPDSAAGKASLVRAIPEHKPGRRGDRERSRPGHRERRPGASERGDRRPRSDPGAGHRLEQRLVEAHHQRHPRALPSPPGARFGAATPRRRCRPRQTPPPTIATASVGATAITRKPIPSERGADARSATATEARASGRRSRRRPPRPPPRPTAVRRSRPEPACSECSREHDLDRDRDREEQDARHLEEHEGSGSPPARGRTRSRRARGPLPERGPATACGRSVAVASVSPITPNRQPSASSAVARPAGRDHRPADRRTEHEAHRESGVRDRVSLPQQARRGGHADGRGAAPGTVP